MYDCSRLLVRLTNGGENYACYGPHVVADVVCALSEKSCSVLTVTMNTVSLKLGEDRKVLLRVNRDMTVSVCCGSKNVLAHAFYDVEAITSVKDDAGIDYQIDNLLYEMWSTNQTISKDAVMAKLGSYNIHVASWNTSPISYLNASVIANAICLVAST